MLYVAGAIIRGWWARQGSPSTPSPPPTFCPRVFLLRGKLKNDHPGKFEKSKEESFPIHHVVSRVVEATRKVLCGRSLAVPRWRLSFFKSWSPTSHLRGQFHGMVTPPFSIAAINVDCPLFTLQWRLEEKRSGVE